MPNVGPALTFRGKVILVEYNANLDNRRTIQAAIHGLIRRCYQDHCSEDQLVRAIQGLVAEYDGLTARLVGRTREAIEFAVTRQ
jgi:hypothetical protein